MSKHPRRPLGELEAFDPGRSLEAGIAILEKGGTPCAHPHYERFYNDAVEAARRDAAEGETPVVPLDYLVAMKIGARRAARGRRAGREGCSPSWA